MWRSQGTSIAPWGVVACPLPLPGLSDWTLANLGRGVAQIAWDRKKTVDRSSPESVFIWKVFLCIWQVFFGGPSTRPIDFSCVANVAGANYISNKSTMVAFKTILIKCKRDLTDISYSNQTPTRQSQEALAARLETGQIAESDDFAFFPQADSILPRPIQIV